MAPVSGIYVGAKAEHVIRSNTGATGDHIAEEVDAGSDRKVSEYRVQESGCPC